MSTAGALRNRPLAFVTDLGRPRLEPDDHHHLEKALRIEPGQSITIGDGHGRWREARFGPEPEPVGEIFSVEPARPPLRVAFTPVKGERPEWFVQKLTELGIDQIAMITTERSVVRWDEARGAKNAERMAKVAREACMQSRRLTLPTIEPAVALEVFLGHHDEAILADPAGRPMGPDDTTIVIGPEGGFSPAETAGRATVSLPGHILRAETAAVTAAVIAAGFRADHVLPAPKPAATNAARG